MFKAQYKCHVIIISPIICESCKHLWNLLIVVLYFKVFKYEQLHLGNQVRPHGVDENRLEVCCVTLH